MRDEIHGKWEAKVSFINQFKVKIELPDNVYYALFPSNYNYLTTVNGDNHFIRLMSADFTWNMYGSNRPDFDTAVKNINISLYKNGYEMMHYVVPELNASEERIRIGARIKELRQKQKIDAKTLAIRAGINASNLSCIEQGHYSVGLDILSKIAYALNARIELVEKEKEEKQIKK